MTQHPSAAAPDAFEPGTAGRIGQRLGKVSEFTVITPLKPGGAEQLRRVIHEQLGGRFNVLEGINTIHDLRFVFLNHDTQLLFATTYDGDWDTYVDDFATKIPDQVDLIFSAVEGWPGIRSPEVKDFIAKYQITADAWYVAYPNATVNDIVRGQRVLAAFQELLDAAS